MTTTTYSFIALIFVAAMLSFIFGVMQMKYNNLLEEKDAFECGFIVAPKIKSTFSINYFFMTIVFLMFDLEVVFIAPIVIFNATGAHAILVIILASFFTYILVMEWMNSMLEWQT